MRVLWKSLIILCFLTGAGLEKDTDFTEKNAGFSLIIPKQAIRLASPEAAAALVLKFGPDTVPNFNVVVTPGSYELFSSPVSLQSSRILDSYRSLGIAQAKILEVQLTESSCGLSLDTELSYELSGKPYRSWVKIVSGSDRHFTLTFIDLLDSNDSHSSDRKLLFESFCPLSRLADPANSAGNRLWSYLGYAALALAAVLAMFKFRRSFY